jgi:hypothetical protein
MSRKSKNLLDLAQSFRNPKSTSSLQVGPIIGGGIAAVVLGRYLWRYYQDHPEILTSLREGFESLEERLRDFQRPKKKAHQKTNQKGDQKVSDLEARH